MPVDVRLGSLGPPPIRVIATGPRAGEVVPIHEVILPGWGDIIKISPSGSLTPAEAELARIRRIAQLARSPTPEVLDNIAKIGQAVDDVQDAAVTLSVAGRIATKLTGLAIPGLGVISGVADVLNVVNVFYPKAAAGAATGAITRTGAKLSGRKKYLASKSVKRALGLAPDASVGTYLRRLEETVKTGRVNVGLGELLQIGQTSEALTGIGLALGPIFGGIQDTLSGLLRGARFDLTGPLGLTGTPESAASLDHMRQFAPAQYEMLESRARDLAQQQSLTAPSNPDQVAKILADNPVRVQLDFPGIIPSIDILRGLEPGATEADLSRILGPVADVVNRGAEAGIAVITEIKSSLIFTATKVFSAAGWLVGLRGDLSWSDHIEITAALFLAMQELAPLLAQVDWSIPAAAAAAREQESLPFCPRLHDHARDAGSVANCLARGPASLPFDWINEAPTPEAREFSVALIDAVATLVPSFLEGPRARVQFDSGVYFRAVRLMHEYNLLPPYDRLDVEVIDYIERIVAEFRDPEWGPPTFDAVRSSFLLSFRGADPD